MTRSLTMTDYPAEVWELQKLLLDRARAPDFAPSSETPGGYVGSTRTIKKALLALRVEKSR